jgi:hypothetical protein
MGGDATLEWLVGDMMHSPRLRVAACQSCWLISEFVHAELLVCFFAMCLPARTSYSTTAAFQGPAVSIGEWREYVSFGNTMCRRTAA